MNKDQIIKFCDSCTETKERDNKEKYVSFNEANGFAKELWVDIKNILYENDFQIYDSYYNTFDEVMLAISEWLKYNDLSKISDIDVYLFTDLNIEADIYTYDLLEWVKDGNNYIYVDDALKESDIKEFINLLKYAQMNYKEDIIYMCLKVIDYLINYKEVVK